MMVLSLSSLSIDHSTPNGSLILERMLFGCMSERAGCLLKPSSEPVGKRHSTGNGPWLGQEVLLSRSELSPFPSCLRGSLLLFLSANRFGLASVTGLIRLLQGPLHMFLGRVSL